ncbi:hypothetical protein METHB2_230019 [Candidatus Methylobacter favarea]|uniref:Transposase InsH N-terminal domain-containing protein n=1 Tax=Candidatus Methylobacter favarea TaxID=2707345 RepID=A0A8S0XFL8_9GAMM|nr:hypothetical protein METHB2_230019 [Candidatus Methylobacter favarea]
MKAVYPIRDQFNFMRFSGLQLEDQVPDSKAVWTFRDAIKGTSLWPRRSS